MVDPCPTAPTLGVIIRGRRLELGLTQEQLAELIGDGVRQAEVSRLERDRIILPRRPRLEAIAGALNLPIGALLMRSGWAGATRRPAVDVVPARARSGQQPSQKSESDGNRSCLPAVN